VLAGRNSPRWTHRTTVEGATPNARAISAAVRKCPLSFAIALHHTNMHLGLQVSTELAALVARTGKQEGKKGEEAQLASRERLSQPWASSPQEVRRRGAWEGLAAWIWRPTGVARAVVSVAGQTESEGQHRRGARKARS